MGKSLGEHQSAGGRDNGEPCIRGVHSLLLNGQKTLAAMGPLAVVVEEVEAAVEVGQKGGCQRCWLEYGRNGLAEEHFAVCSIGYMVAEEEVCGVFFRWTFFEMSIKKIEKERKGKGMAGGGTV